MVAVIRETFTLLDTPTYTVQAQYSVDEKDDAVEVWRVLIEEFTPHYNTQGGASVVSGWEKLLRVKKGNTTNDQVEETIVRDAWRLRQSLRDEFKEKLG